MTILSATFGSYISAYACPCKVVADDKPHRQKVRKLPDFAASAMDEVVIVDHDHYLDSAANSSTEFEWVRKEPGYWQAVLDSVHAEEERRAAKAKKLAETTKDEWITKVKAYVHKILTRKEWKSEPKALEAVQAEGAALVEAGTWLLDSVTEKDDLIHLA